MGIKEWWNNLPNGKPKLNSHKQSLPEPKETPPMPKVAPPKLTPKEIATSKGEPWVTVMGMEVDLDNIREGNFELDWNDTFVAKLVRAGYKGKTDVDIVDQWFQDVCRNIALESFEQEMADPDKRADWIARTNSLGPQ